MLDLLAGRAVYGVVTIFAALAGWRAVQLIADAAHQWAGHIQAAVNLSGQ